MSSKSKLYDNLGNRNGPKGILGDFTHASELYRRNNYRLAPKTKFLYHVVVNVNSVALAQLGGTVANNLGKREFNLLAQTVDLPTFTTDLETKNQYNRKRIVQTRINYNPIAIRFHDDNAGLTTLLWEAYYRYYFQDGNYSTINGTGRPFSYNTKMYASSASSAYKYGLDKQNWLSLFNLNYNFFDSIVVNQLHSEDANPRFTSFTLVNPFIEELSHDTHEATSGNGTMLTTMRIAYETVLYNRGYTSTDNPSGFADPSHYDVTPSPYNYTTSNETVGERNAQGAWRSNFFDENIEAVSEDTYQDFRNRRDKATNSRNPVGVNPREDINSTNIFPRNDNNQNITPSQPYVDRRQTEDQEFRRELQNNPKKLDDFSKSKFALEYSIANGTSINDARNVYNNLSENVKQQVRQITLNNISSFSSGNTLSYANDLAAAGII